MIALLTASLAACGLFNSQKTISKVDIDVISGLENQGGVYVAHIGEEFVLSANWYNDRVTKADVEWHEIANGEEKRWEERQRHFRTLIHAKIWTNFSVLRRCKRQREVGQNIRASRGRAFVRSGVERKSRNHRQRYSTESYRRSNRRRVERKLERKCP